MLFSAHCHSCHSILSIDTCLHVEQPKPTVPEANDTLNTGMVLYLSQSLQLWTKLKTELQTVYIERAKFHFTIYTDPWTVEDLLHEEDIIDKVPLQRLQLLGINTK